MQLCLVCDSAMSHVGDPTELYLTLNGLFLFTKVGQGPDAESGLAALLGQVFWGLPIVGVTWIPWFG